MPKLSKLRKVVIVAFYAAWFAWVVIVGFQVKNILSSTVKERVVNLMVAKHESAELPIYSKFYVTQTVAIPTPASLSSISIPVRQPFGGESNVYVSAQSDSQETVGNNFSVTPQTSEISLPLNFNKPVNKLTVMISAVDVSWKTKDTVAPRVYRELSKSGYREGEMTIAGIKKEGNIGLSVYATYSRFSYMRKQFNENRKIVASWTRELLLVFIVIVWPSIFIDFVSIKKE